MTRVYYQVRTGSFEMDDSESVGPLFRKRSEAIAYGKQHIYPAPYYVIKLDESSLSDYEDLIED